MRPKTAIDRLWQRENLAWLIATAALLVAALAVDDKNYLETITVPLALVSFALSIAVLLIQEWRASDHGVELQATLRGLDARLEDSRRAFEAVRSATEQIKRASDRMEQALNAQLRIGASSEKVTSDSQAPVGDVSLHGRSDRARPASRSADRRKLSSDASQILDRFEQQLYDLPYEQSGIALPPNTAGIAELLQSELLVEEDGFPDWFTPQPPSGSRFYRLPAGSSQ